MRVLIWGRPIDLLFRTIMTVCLRRVVLLLPFGHCQLDTGRTMQDEGSGRDQVLSSSKGAHRVLRVLGDLCL
jgi:hypothetical protein